MLIDEVQILIDVCVFENVLRAINRIMDEELVFYNYDVELINNYVTTTGRPQTENGTS